MGKNSELRGQRNFEGEESESEPVLVKLEKPDEDGNFWAVSLRDKRDRIKFGLSPDKTRLLIIAEEGFLQPNERQQAFKFASGVLFEAEETGRFRPKQQTPVQENQAEFPI
ncbi:MAG: hypothetical protein PHV43_00895 [Candidatus Colwellbacteria bacterium]|nr:hypothetical protein [Candidatus Colwellbacteria bacterium]